MKRRTFLWNAGAATASASLFPAQLIARSEPAAISGKLIIEEGKTLAEVPGDFIGLSYESAQLANPAFFAAENTTLINRFRELTGSGVLRLGGGTSDFTLFTDEEVKGPAPFDAAGPDTSKNVKTDMPVTPKGLRNLRGFLDAAGWRCLYGLNLARGTAETMAEEARAAQNILGPRLIAFQLGNEPDAWRNRYRPANWTDADYWKDWVVARQAVLAKVPEAKFAGPDVSNKMAYVSGFADYVKKNAPEVVMLTSHYYAMGPAGAPGMTVERLLGADPKLEADLKTAMEAARNAGLPYRITECNSCWNGGQEGVSDTLASALWATDAILHFAAAGCAGVNMHGGGNGIYTPIAGDLHTGFQTRPVYAGMRLASAYAGATMIDSALECASDRVRAYAGVKGGALLITAINKTEEPVAIELTIDAARKPRLDRASQYELSGPAVDAKSGIAMRKSSASAFKNDLLSLNPYSAVTIVL